jgi:hypothetical protein
MRDLEKSGQVKWLLEIITNIVESCEKDFNPIYFDYDGVIGLLEQAQMLVAESARCPCPADLPPELPWCEKLYDSDEVFDPYTYDGTMSAEDYEKMRDLMNDNEESEEWER